MDVAPCGSWSRVPAGDYLRGVMVVPVGDSDTSCNARVAALRIRWEMAMFRAHGFGGLLSRDSVSGM